MGIEIKFDEVFNAPMGSPRPRFSTKGRYVHTHTCLQTIQNMKKYLQSQMPRLNLENALKIELAFYFYSPESWSKREKESSSDWTIKSD
ncbi:RusA family crossover junction endodeoxyribonuclease [Staphylococcus aureus]